MVPALVAILRRSRIPIWWCLFGLNLVETRMSGGGSGLKEPRRALAPESLVSYALSTAPYRFVIARTRRMATDSPNHYASRRASGYAYRT